VSLIVTDGDSVRVTVGVDTCVSTLCVDEEDRLRRSVGRLMATRSLALCSADAAADGGGLIALDLNVCSAVGGYDDEDSAAADAARSAVVSNVIILVAVAGAAALLVLVYACARRVSAADAAAALCMPSSLLPVWVAALQSTAAAATLLLGRLPASRCAATDAALGVLGCAVALLPPAVVVFVWHTRAVGPRPRWVCSHHAAPPRASRCLRLYERCVARSWRWAPAAPLSGSDGMEHAWALLLEHRLLWYAAADPCLLALLSCLAVVGGLGSSLPQCQALAAAAAAVVVGQLVLVLAARPYTTLFAHVHSALSLLLTALSVLAQLAFLLTSATSTAGLWLLEGAAVCNLATVGVSCVKLLSDLVQLCKSIRRRVVVCRTSFELDRSRGGTAVKSFSHKHDDEAVPVALDDMVLDDTDNWVPCDEVVLHEIDAMADGHSFWNSPGTGAAEVSGLLAIGHVPAHDLRSYFVLPVEETTLTK
jgi:hypothetical protein